MIPPARDPNLKYARAPWLPSAQVGLGPPRHPVAEAEEPPERPGYKHQFSWSLLVPLGWLIISVAPFLFYLGSLGPNADPDEELVANKLEPKLLAPLLLAALVIFYQRRHQLLELIERNIFLFLLFGYMLLSVFWADDPMLVVKRGARTFGSVMMMTIVLTERYPALAMRRLFLPLFFLSLGTSVFLIHFMPDYGTRVTNDGVEVWVGVTMNKNQLGPLSALGALYALWALAFVRNLEWKPAHALTLLFGLYICLGSNSMTSVVILLMGIGLLLVLRMCYPYLYRATAVMVLGGAMSLGGLFMVSELALHSTIPQLVTGTLNRDLTLTGRTDLWVDVIADVQDRPVLGYGFGNYWIEGRLADKYTWEPNQAHNGYVDTYAELGGLGLFLLLGYLTQSWLHNLFVYRRSPDFGSFRLVLFVLILVSNFTESSLLRLNNQMWVFFALASITPPGAGFVGAPDDEDDGEELPENEIVVVNG